MMRSLTTLSCLVAAGALAGCATLEIDSDAERSGAPFHDVRPYLVISQAADCSRTASVLSLPDMSRTYYVRPRGGLGKNTLSANFSNGLLTTFNQETDVDPTGLISTVAGLFGIGGEGPDRGGGDKGGPVIEGHDRPQTCPVTSWIFVMGDDGQLTPATPPIK
ncbi:MAG: hypothetical protein HY859_13845 [Caulobacterales bacterium]|nr:hypothetical protein [Caulobacterales bacterium]